MTTALLILLLLGFLSAHGTKTELRLQTLVPLRNQVFWGEGVIPAMYMALEDVNNRTGLLDNYKLVADISNTKCDSSEGTWQLIKAILDTEGDDKTKIITFLGASCSLATEPTAALTGRLYKVVQVSYASYSPVLSQRSMYPLFLRTSPSELLYNDARYALMKTYNWCYVATLHQTANIFSLAVQDFHDNYRETLAGPGSYCNTSDKNPVLFSFTGDPEIPLMQIKNKKIRIIYGFFYEDKALIVMCYAYHMGLATSNHLWILPSWFSEGWWNVADSDSIDWSNYRYRCNASHIIEAVQYSILLDVYTYLTDPDQVSLGGLTNRTFFEEYLQRRDAYFNITENTPSEDTPSILYSTLIYDAVWAVALSLNETETQLQATGHNLTEFSYSDSSNGQPTFSSNVSQMIVDNMQKLDFIGISGRVMFDSNGTRLAQTGISQYIPRDNGTSLTQVLLAVYNRLETNLTINFTSDPFWKLGRPPTDRSTPQSKLLNPGWIYSMNVIIAIGIVVAVVFLIFNIVTIRKPLIANSTPYINMIITVGCIIMMATSILLGIDSGTPQVTSGDRVNVLDDIDDAGKRRYAIICMVRVWLFTIGFTLSFGALFTKTWQVYRVYTKSELKEKPFKMWNFLIIMGIQLGLDVFFLSIWTGLFRFEHYINEMDDADNNVLIKHEKCQCQNFSYLVGALYVYKGLLVVFGLFLAYESRNVKYYYINDSRFVSIAMYIVVILIGISAPLSLVLADRFIIDPAYVVAVIMIVTACMCCLLILYIPKFIYMAKGADTMLPKAKAEVFTPVDNLQLGHTDVNQDDVRSAEQEIKDLKEQVKQREMELQNLQRRGSDQDSGVLCTSIDEPGDSSNSSPDSPTSPRDVTEVTIVSNTEDGEMIVLERPRKKTVTLSPPEDIISSSEP